MSEAEVPEVPTYDVPERLLGKDGRPKPHVDAAKYKSDYSQSIDNPDEFFGKVSSALFAVGRMQSLIIVE